MKRLGDIASKRRRWRQRIMDLNTYLVNKYESESRPKELWCGSVLFKYQFDHIAIFIAIRGVAVCQS